jgi:hypothetical protein
MQALELKPHTKGQLIFHGGLALFTFNKGGKHMKPIIIALSTLMFCTGCPSTPEQSNLQQQLQQAQDQLVKQQSSTGNWQIVAGIFAVGCILLFIIGTAIGSKARREAKREKDT